MDFGLESQRLAVTAWILSHSETILPICSELETARKKDLRNRSQLISAPVHARHAKALLVIARLDRLARNVFVTSQLLEGVVESVACNNPHANRMSIQTLAVMAEHESHMISERVKATLAVRRARDDVFRCDRKLMPRAVTNEATERRMVENRRVPAFVISQA